MALPLPSTRPQAALEALFEAMRLLFRIFYSFSQFDLPDVVEDHLREWMNLHLKYLTVRAEVVVDSTEVRGRSRSASPPGPAAPSAPHARTHTYSHWLPGRRARPAGTLEGRRDGERGAVRRPVRRGL